MIFGIGRSDEAVNAPEILRERVHAIAPKAVRVQLSRPAFAPNPFLCSRREITVIDQHGRELDGMHIVYGGRDELRSRLERALPRGWPDVEYDVHARTLSPIT
ncbi:hypothetical protein B4N89_27285 [Embleya scabrispora]|uniref:Uncharacterized protein n=1 Tax=Embleya scabrispora TaxID=159449 RepID=A0A1T3P5C0_9ACTN|nr:hypothetical protein [Embleya scabrispora]OPC84135.1 hypothetical protein B4N89_27285 [Embleya scabrispora]